MVTDYLDWPPRGATLGPHKRADQDFYGRCVCVCGQRIVVGDTIAYDDDRWCHRRCTSQETQAS